MYRCQMCQCVVPAGTPSHKVVVKTRQKEYAARGRPERERDRPMRRPIRRPPALPAYDKGGTGYETVQELTVCADCESKFRQEKEEVARVQEEA